MLRNNVLKSSYKTESASSINKEITYLLSCGDAHLCCDSSPCVIRASSSEVTPSGQLCDAPDAS